jgi:hypothetical protein
MTALPALPSRLRRSRCRPPTWRPRHHSPVRRRRQPRARPTGATSPPFASWCLGKGVDALPAAPESVAAYLAYEAERGSAPSTITRRCAAIRYAHRLADLEPPTASEHVRATLRGIRRAIGAAPAPRAPVLAEQACAMADAAPANLKGLRDRALLSLGFALRIPPLGARGPRCRRSSGNR